MTNYQWHNPEAAVSKPKVEDPSDAFYNEVVKVIEDLVKDGLFTIPHILMSGATI